MNKMQHTYTCIAASKMHSFHTHNAVHQKKLLPKAKFLCSCWGADKNVAAKMNKKCIGSKLGPDQAKESVAAFDEISAKLVHLIRSVHLQHDLFPGVVQHVTCKINIAPSNVHKFHFLSAVYNHEISEPIR